jgi:uncharacterized protein
MNVNGFLLDLATLPTGRSEVVLESDPADLELGLPQWPTRIRAELGVEKSGEQVSVRGRLRAVAELECVRCLRTFELQLAPEFEVFAERGGAGRHRNEEDELERDRYMLFHDGRRLDLRGEAREKLLLELPMAPRCREECRGLCPRCGADLNDGPCGCSF